MLSVGLIQKFSECTKLQLSMGVCVFLSLRVCCWICVCDYSLCVFLISFASSSLLENRVFFTLKIMDIVAVGYI